MDLSGDYCWLSQLLWAPFQVQISHGTDILWAVQSHCGPAVTQESVSQVSTVPQLCYNLDCLITGTLVSSYQLQGQYKNKASSLVWSLLSLKHFTVNQPQESSSVTKPTNSWTHFPFDFSLWPWVLDLVQILCRRIWVWIWTGLADLINSNHIKYKAIYEVDHQEGNKYLFRPGKLYFIPFFTSSCFLTHWNASVLVVTFWGNKIKLV